MFNNRGPAYDKNGHACGPGASNRDFIMRNNINNIFWVDLYCNCNSTNVELKMIQSIYKL